MELALTVLFQSFLRLQPPSALMAHSTSISTSFRPTWYPTLEFTSLLSHTPQSSLLPRHHTRRTLSRKFRCHASSPTTRWSSAILATANIWLPACCTVGMSYQRMYTLPSLLSRPNAPYNSSTGVPPDSKLVSATSHRRWCQTEILLRSTALCTFQLTLLPSRDTDL